MAVRRIGGLWDGECWEIGRCADEMAGARETPEGKTKTKTKTKTKEACHPAMTPGLIPILMYSSEILVMREHYRTVSAARRVV
jgi:hypothetical protein